MATQPKQGLTPDEYLRRERLADSKSEYVNGEVFARAGASLTHNALVKNLSDFFTNHKLRASFCTAFTADMKVYLSGDGVYCYPDFSVCCGAPIFYDEHTDVLMNPTIVFEVLSPSTMAYDLGDKSFYYRRNASLQHVVLIWNDRVKGNHWAKEADQSWSFHEIQGEDQALSLPELGLAVPLSEIYEDVLL